MTAIGRIIAVAGVALGLAGCGPGVDWTGTWLGERDLPVQPGTDPALTLTLKQVRLEVKGNREFELVEGGVPRAGMFHPSGEEARLETLSVAGQEPENVPDARLTLQPDGSALLEDPLHPGAPVRLRREPQPPASSVRNP